MGRIRTYSQNIIFSYLGHAANILVVFFLSPFVINNLGDQAYGIWVMLAGITGYLGLVELGVRGSTGRFINYNIG